MPTNKQRRDAARRQLERQLQDRAVQEAARRRTTLIASAVSTVVVLAIIVVVAVLIVGGNDKKPAAAGGAAGFGATGTNQAPAPAKGACDFTKQGSAARQVSLPDANPPKSGQVTVAVSTSRGPMEFTLDRAKAPCTVESFASLVKQKYYDDTPCHRLTTSGIFVLQCGDPTGSGTGGPGYTIPDEYTGSEKYGTGVLAMANTGSAHSGGGQFFIVYKDTQLPPSYTIFGTVTKGMQVVDAVAAKGSDNSNGNGDGKPNLPIQITSAKVML